MRCAPIFRPDKGGFLAKRYLEAVDTLARARSQEQGTFAKISRWVFNIIGILVLLRWLFGALGFFGGAW